jgi:hypothetical protein
MLVFMTDPARSHHEEMNQRRCATALGEHVDA